MGEAIARSIPCIAPRNVGLANLLLNNGKYGYLYKQGNNDNFKQKIIYCLKNYKKSIDKSKLALKGLERFDKKNTLKKLNTVFSKI